MRCAIALLAVWLTVAAAHAADVSSNTLTFEGHVRTWALYAPARADGNPLPLLVLLHGSGGSGAFMIGKWKDFAEREGIVLLAPDSLRSDAWRLKEDNPDYIHAVVDAAASQVRIDPRRIYAFGQSGGAVYALELAMLESRYFAAVAVHAGAWRSPEEFTIMHLAKRKTPVKIIIGDHDEFFPQTDVHKTIDLLRENGFPAELDILQDQFHAYTNDNAPAIDSSAWAFLRTHMLDESPVFTSYRLARDTRS
jgi:poly(3-hydroxybutyrate) depolymerase